MGTSRFPVSYWCPPGLDETDQTYFDDMEHLGINLIPTPVFAGSAEEKPRALAFLDECARRGLSVMLFDRRVMYGEGLPIRGGVLDEAAYARSVRESFADYGKHPAVTCFYVGDEPNRDAYGPMCACVRTVRKETGKEGYVNLLPFYPKFPSATGAADYEAYLKQFVLDSGTKALSEDFYAQCLEGDITHEDYWYVLACQLNAAKATGAEPWHTVLSCKHFDRRLPTYEDFRFQISMALAYGSKEISYFTLHTLPNAAPFETNFTGGPFDWHNRKTPVFEDLARANEELHIRFGNKMKDLVHRRTTHFPLVPYTYRKPLPAVLADGFTPDEVVYAVSIGRGLPRQHLVIGEFSDPGTGEDYVFVANANPRASVSAFVTMARAKEVRRYDAAGREYTAYAQNEAGPLRVGMWLAPGQAELHRIIR